ncbi:MAG: hypothetical protein AB1489_38270 [Acidobacteriota bacterium]
MRKAKVKKKERKGKARKSLIPIDILNERLEILESVLGGEEAVGKWLGISRRTVHHWKSQTRAITATALLLMEKVEEELLSEETIQRIRKKFPSLWDKLSKPDLSKD